MSRQHNPDRAAHEVQKLYREQQEIRKRRNEELARVPSGKGGHAERVAILRDARQRVHATKAEAEKVVGDLLIHGE